MRKSAASGEDHYLALLNLRNTPTEGLGSSPCQRMFGRHARTVLPILPHLLDRREAPKGEHGILSRRRERTAAQRNSSRRDLAPLKTGGLVRMQPIQGQREWRPAVVRARIGDRQYVVKTENGKEYRRNRALLRSTNDTEASEIRNNDAVSCQTELALNGGEAGASAPDLPAENCTEFHGTEEEHTSPNVRTTQRTTKSIERLDLGIPGRTSQHYGYASTGTH